MQVRGDILFSLRHFVERSYGSEGYDAWLTSMPSSSSSIYGPDLTVASWYPLDKAFVVPLEWMCALFHDGDMEGAREFGKHLCDHHFWGKRVMLKMDEPENVLRREGSSLLAFCGPGVVEAPMAVPFRTVIRLWRFEGMHPAVENFFGGYLERVAEHSGGEHTHYEINASLADGSPYSELVLTWE